MYKNRYDYEGGCSLDSFFCPWCQVEFSESEKCKKLGVVCKKCGAKAERVFKRDNISSLLKKRDQIKKELAPYRSKKCDKCGRYGPAHEFAKVVDSPYKEVCGGCAFTLKKYGEKIISHPDKFKAVGLIDELMGVEVRLRTLIGDSIPDYVLERLIYFEK